MGGGKKDITLGFNRASYFFFFERKLHHIRVFFNFSICLCLSSGCRNLLSNSFCLSHSLLGNCMRYGRSIDNPSSFICTYSILSVKSKGFITRVHSSEFFSCAWYGML